MIISEFFEDQFDFILSEDQSRHLQGPTVSTRPCVPLYLIKLEFTKTEQKHYTKMFGMTLS